MISPRAAVMLALVVALVGCDELPKQSNKDRLNEAHDLADSAASEVQRMSKDNKDGAKRLDDIETRQSSMSYKQDDQERRLRVLESKVQSIHP